MSRLSTACLVFLLMAAIVSMIILASWNFSSTQTLMDAAGKSIPKNPIQEIADAPNQRVLSGSEKSGEPDSSAEQ